MGLVGTIEEDGRMTESSMPARDPAFIAHLRHLAGLRPITKVAVATGPGSFTGLRKGVSFGLGLAMGLRIPIVPLPTLELQAARSDQPVTAISEAGRGRFYYLVPGEKIALGEPAEIPTGHQLVGMVSPAGLRPVVAAAALLLKTAREVPYGSLKLEYMQSFAARAE